MRSKSIQQAALLRARDLAGGVSYLGQDLGVDADTLDAMLNGTAEIPAWIFLRAVDFINEAEASGAMPPDFPVNWQNVPDDQREG